jgi:hypothetical protein
LLPLSYTSVYIFPSLTLLVIFLGCALTLPLYTFLSRQRIASINLANVCNELWMAAMQMSVTHSDSHSATPVALQPHVNPNDLWLSETKRCFMLMFAFP